MTRERWVRNLADAARGYREPPETPRERMWERIDDARSEARESTPRIERPGPWWSQRRVIWPAAVVAALVIGLSIGRITSPSGRIAVVDTPVVATATPTPAPSGIPDSAYRLAAIPVLARTETLLLQVRTGTGQSTDQSGGSYTVRAAALLAQTRLLLASPAGRDDELAPLLRDLELALARIVRFTGGARAIDDVGPDQKSLQDGLERKAVLPRIRDLLNTGPVVVES